MISGGHLPPKKRKENRPQSPSQQVIFFWEYLAVECLYLVFSLQPRLLPHQMTICLTVSWWLGPCLQPWLSGKKWRTFLGVRWDLLCHRLWVRWSYTTECELTNICTETASYNLQERSPQTQRSVWPSQPPPPTSLPPPPSPSPAAPASSCCSSSSSQRTVNWQTEKVQER